MSNKYDNLSSKINEALNNSLSNGYWDYTPDSMWQWTDEEVAADLIAYDDTFQTFDSTTPLLLRHIKKWRHANGLNYVP